MKTKHVIVEPYNEIWTKEFEKIKAEIEPALENLCLGIEHIGSTSVIGLSAKPIIDIDVVIEDYSVFPEVIKKLNSIGYIHEGDLGIKDREYNDITSGRTSQFYRYFFEMLCVFIQRDIIQAQAIRSRHMLEFFERKGDLI